MIVLSAPRSKGGLNFLYLVLDALIIFFVISSSLFKGVLTKFLEKNHHNLTAHHGGFADLLSDVHRVMLQKPHYIAYFPNFHITLSTFPKCSKGILPAPHLTPYIFNS